MSTRTIGRLVALGLFAFGLGSCWDLDTISPRRAEQLDADFLTGSTGFRLGTSPWAPDGESLIVCAKGKLFRVLADGTGATQLTQDPARQASLSADGRWIAFNRAPSLLLEDDLHPKDRLSWLSVDGAEHGSLALWLDGLAWSPDGAWMACSRWIDQTDKPSEVRIVLVPRAGGDWQDIGPGDTPAWSPDGARIACSVPEGFLNWIEVVNRDGSGRVRLTSGTWPCWSRDGQQLALVDTDGDLGAAVFSMAVSGGERRALGEGFMPSWSPTDDRLLFTRLDQRDTRAHPLVTIRPDGSDELVLAQAGWGGRWSPDGSRVAFLRYFATPSSGELIVVNADGSGERSLGSLDDFAASAPQK